MESLEFVWQKESLLFLGPPGMGKTHLAIALGVAGCRAGLQTYFTTLAELLARLLEAQRPSGIATRLQFYAKHTLLLTDEVGYLPLAPSGPNLFFQFVNTRYERGSVSLISNKPFREWGQIFGDEVIVGALLDRLLHHLVVINIRGPPTGSGSTPPSSAASPHAPAGHASGTTAPHRLSGREVRHRRIPSALVSLGKSKCWDQ